MEPMDKNYDHNASEDKIYASWDASGAMRADAKSKKKKFTIPLPPPNVTGELHLGHAAMLAIEDIMIRFKKMTGHEALWVPGTDHAAIATENVVLKHLGIKSREEMKREDFLKECRKFATAKHDRIEHQIKKMGAWLDWSREAYTFDEPRNHAVNTMFKKLYDDGLIVRGHRMINWSVGAQSVLSDDEVVYKEVKGGLYHYKYFFVNSENFLEIATTRPETMFGDTAVALNPHDPRAKKLHGKKVKVPFSGREIPVILDDHVDLEFGTATLKVTPAHDPNDFEIGEKHNLEKIQVIGFDGKMETNNYVPKKFQKLNSKECRKLLTEPSEWFVKKEEHLHNIGFCYRSNTIVEPMISPQWFISVDKEFTDTFTGKKTTLKKLTAEAVRSGDVKIIPKQFEKVYFHWIDNLRDWCISRQIWWGHRIPVWYDGENNIHLPQEQKIIFARHGETEWNVLGKYQGTSDSPLTKKGEDQAKELAKKIKNKNITKIICSPLLRAKRTAEIVSKKLGIDLEIWDDLHEVSYGTFEGRTKKELKGHVLHHIFAQQGIAGFKSPYERAQKIWERLKKIDAKENVLVVGHAGILRFLFAVHNNVKLDGFLNFFKKWEHIKNSEPIEINLLQPPTEKDLHQDKDTLDTWFSSASWPFSTLGWPNKEAEDFKKFYPTDVLETGHDILFFWVARMIMFGRYATGQYPFHTVYLHGLVTDEHGKKMSKSSNNGIDPLKVIDKFGADAVRLSLVVGTATGQPIPLGEGKISGYRNFVNKLWNAGRFTKLQTTNIQTTKSLEPKSLADRWIASRFTKISKEIKKHLDKYEISMAGDKIYHFVWDDFCDWYIEASKKEPNPDFLRYLFNEILKLAHPLCPFITEKLWQELGNKKLIIEANFPETDYRDKKAEELFEKFQAELTETRKKQADKQANLKEKAKLEKDIPALEARLKNKGYLDKAPPTLVEQTKKELKEAKEKLKELS